MRRAFWIFVALLGLSVPTAAFAWEFTADPICTIRHEAGAGDWRITYDPRSALYAITVDAPSWAAAPEFGIRFEGGDPLTIRTGAHFLSDDGKTVIVRDRGFGNVLNGLQFNATATAFLGTRSVSVGLMGAAPAVEAFKACIQAPGV
ncbi:MAG: excinuclease ABC subunit B [Pseudomonadota bacterium]